MAHISPAVHLIWALLSVLLGSFLLFHLWSFDRFKCLKWDHGPHSGAFKRVMKYSYLLSVPLLVIYAVGFAIIKYTYGYTTIPGSGILPTPYELWSPTAQNAIFPLYLSFSIAWGLEMVTHLEELCFWLFLMNSCSAHQDWFRSPYFKIWTIGSCIAVLAIPSVTIFTRKDMYKCESYTFLAGGLGSFSLTIGFLPVLWTFPSFLENLKQHEVETATLIRLTTFHELNCIRVVFRFLFTIPLVILGIDGVRPHQYINDKMLPTDLLGIIAGIGCIVSSGLTLVIFFPRSIESEMTFKEQQRIHRRRRGQRNQSRLDRAHMIQSSESQSYVTIAHSKIDLDRFDGPTLGAQSNASLSLASGLPTYEATTLQGHDHLPSLKATLVGGDRLGSSISLQPNRRNQIGDVELGGVMSVGEVELVRARSTRDRRVSSLVHHWRSPIEIGPPTVSQWQRRMRH